MTVQEVAETIEKEFKFCGCWIEGSEIEVTYRGKKSDKVYIRKGVVTSKGNTNALAAKIAERFELTYKF